MGKGEWLEVGKVGKGNCGEKVEGLGVEKGGKVGVGKRGRVKGGKKGND